MFSRLATVLILLGSIWMPNTVAAAELLYFRSDACTYCEQWDDEVGAIYSKTDEAKIMTLRPVDVHDPQPEDIAFVKGVVFTPTFVVVDKGQEIGRIVGYGSDFFFWENMAVMMKNLEEARATRISGCPEGQKDPANQFC